MNRLSALRSEMKRRSLDAMLITHLPHIHYIAGFSGSAGTLFVTAKRAVFMTDFRYKEQIREELRPGIQGRITSSALDEMLDKKIAVPGMRIAVQEDYINVAAYNMFRKRMKGMKLTTMNGFLDTLTSVKSEDEIANIKKAADIAAKVYEEVLKIAKPGMRENELAAEISYLGRKFGSEGDAFDIIVASGERGALPHGHASTKKLKRGELVTLDFGCIYNGFNSDMTRTFALGKPSAEGRKIYNIVLDALRAGTEIARAGITGKNLDDACRDLIKAAGYGKEFGHATGHGLGIKVHERPYVSFRGDKEVLQENMVVTIEPGIYVPGNCGVRIEDDVVITTDGCRVLTSSPRELIVL